MYNNPPWFFRLFVCYSYYLLSYEVHIDNFWFAVLQSSLDSLEKKNSTLELELIKAQKENNNTIEKLREVEQKCSSLQQNMQRCSFCCPLFFKTSDGFHTLDNWVSVFV